VENVSLNVGDHMKKSNEHKKIEEAIETVMETHNETLLRLRIRELEEREIIAVKALKTIAITDSEVGRWAKRALRDLGIAINDREDNE
jgi:hypothetical protein